MFSWFASRTAVAPGIDERLLQIEREARRAGDPGRGKRLNQAGDICASEGRRSDALAYYGRAVNEYLETGYLGPAAAVCRKIIRYAPETVRAHCTLACLAIQDGFLGEARLEIDRYVEAARISHTEKLAIPRLRLIADAVADEEIRRRIAEHLRDLGDLAGSRRILAAVGDHPAIEGTADHRSKEGQWERLLQAISLSAEELWMHA